jgi:EAL domain-containing protein (putative c-di-GMP-specific phosphodiesterase class I)
VLKIDRALVSRVGSARDTVPAVLRLGSDLGLVVVAEGIEREEQRARLLSAGGTLGQGHLLSRPLDGHAVTDLLRRGRVPMGALPMDGTLVSDVETGHGNR